jgi:hypothetical protein
MPMTKLTLSADLDLIRDAKRIAAHDKTSVSAMFAQFLSVVSRVKKERTFTPGLLTRKASGMIKLARGQAPARVLEDALSSKYGLDK